MHAPGQSARRFAPPAITWNHWFRAGHSYWALQMVLGGGAALVYLAAAGPGLGSLVLLTAVAMLGVAVIAPVAGLTSLVLIMPVREPEIFNPAGINAVLVGATAFGCILRVSNDRLPLRINPGIVLLIGYVVYSALSVPPFISAHPAAWAPSAGLEFIRMTTGVGLFIVASYIFRTVPNGPFILAALVGAGLATAVATGAFLNVGPIDSLFDAVLTPLGGDRAVGGFSNPNYLGVFAAQSFILAAASWWQAKGRLKLLLLLIMVAIVSALMFSFSRSAYLAAGIGVLIMIATRNWRLAIVLAIVLALVAAIVYPLFLEARLGTDTLDPKVLAERTQSENWRRIAIEAGFSIFALNPIFGVGFGVFHFVSPAFVGASPATYSHNQYVNILAEQGVVGIAMVAGIVVMLLLRLWRSTHPLRGAAIAMICAYLIQSTFINSTTSFQISGLTWLTMAAALSAADRLPALQPKEA